ncbi:MAG: adenylosuccinate synthase [Bacteroidales bacterium]|jgi:adenylosuccinate synthase|nr:adenylosuccinate synthase [Bacteroidales bacterium]HNT41533.1 adenylosuccinate synthase [Tenuifilaceae bacterium]MBP8644100.1 adenylosuccinate synthase [Bacteroidales bacterium]HOA10296.1 adenylosuccinate synthase [Tenuifilaceae bacterium]HOC37108.1 adenylosuccinate synthase [Tenuifilaceae bacterium]
MTKVDVLLGLQWGDEGKGKVVDVLTPNYDAIARFQGGPNAGHSIEFNSIKHVLHTIPSGIFHPSCINIIGNGVVLDPIVFAEEVEILTKMNVDLHKTLLISKKAHLILPSHRELDAASEAAKGKGKIGSTLRGIGPTYMDKTGRNGLRVGDILSPDFTRNYEFLKNKHKELLQQYTYQSNIEQHEDAWFKGVEVIKQFRLVDSEYDINEMLVAGKRVLAEGAQGSLLDIDFGSYPFVTSSNTICAGACTGLGVSPHSIGEVYGIFKAYCTRVGSGPFPTEQENDTGEKMRNLGVEFGATTGRPRRCGWLDMVALKYAIMLNGVTRLIMTKADVLDSFDTIRVAVAYLVNGKQTTRLPYDINVPVEPVYKEFKGWNSDITGITNEQDLPVELAEYIRFIEHETGVPIHIVSVGPNRDSTIVRA